MRVTAAVIDQPGGPPRLRPLDLDAPRPDEVRVRMVATGVCHTDLNIRDQVYPTALPAVLGHEGAGIVEAVGAAVPNLSPGDHVVLSANSCGGCRPCLAGEPAYCADLFARNFGMSRPDGSCPLTHDGQPVASMFFGQSSFSTHANVAYRGVVKVDDDVDLTVVAPLGCGIQTGAGAVLNQLKPRPGSSVGVFGAGAVGMAAIMAAAVTGCTTIVAVDVIDARLELAHRLGATHIVNGAGEGLDVRLDEICCGAGLDYALDTTGNPKVLQTATAALGIRGTVALVGAARPGTEVSFEIGASLTKGWTFTTIIEGSAVPQLLIPALIGLWKQGRFPVDQLIRRYPFAEIENAFAAVESGAVIKPVLTFG